MSLTKHTPGLRYRDHGFAHLTADARTLWSHATAPSWSTLANAGRLVRHLARLLRSLRQVPALDIPLSRSPEGEMIRAHLACRRFGVPRFRLAQGVLRLPERPETYRRGRARQAVRTNVRRATEAGLRVTCEPVPFSHVAQTPGLGGDANVRSRARSESVEGQGRRR